MTPTPPDFIITAIMENEAVIETDGYIMTGTDGNAVLMFIPNAPHDIMGMPYATYFETYTPWENLTKSIIREFIYALPTCKAAENTIIYYSADLKIPD